MTIPILSVAIRNEQDTVTARQRSRQIAKLVGFHSRDQTRLATAVSEIARNAFRYAGGGRAEFILEGATAPQLLIIRVSDKGPGIADLDSILNGTYSSSTGMGMGIAGSRRLVDQLDVRTESGRGTTVSMKKMLPRNVSLLTPDNISALVQKLHSDKPQDALGELQLQNQELMRALDDLRKKQEDLTTLNRELEDTNRGVVALYAELDERADHLRRADSLKSRFLSNMSHEFRSPLNSIMALSGLLMDQTDGPLNSEQLQQVKFVRKAAGDLYELVNDLLDLAKVEAGKVDVKPVHFEVSNLFGALRGMLRPLFLSQSVSLIFEDTEELPCIYTDEGKVSQILRNFISNAMKFTERGEVRVSARVLNGRIHFDVSDTGIGIEPADLERIFQDFVQIDNPIQRRVKGTGLGLPLSRKLAHLLQGDVCVKSEPGAGSVFSLEIPVNLEVEPGEPAVIIEEPAEAGLPVLIVENRSDAALTYSKWLRGSGFVARHASTTRDARARIADSRPAAIILDVLLDGEDTWQLLASLKESSETRSIPVIVVTEVEDPGKAFHLGADEYLVKPVSREALLESIRRQTTERELPTILIIDDEEADRYLLKRRLKHLPVRIIEAADGTDGIAKAITEKPQLIFLDLMMPGLTGYEVMERLKSDARTQSIAVVVNTSKLITEQDRERLEPQAAGLVSKEQIRDSGNEFALAPYLAAAGITQAPSGGVA